MGRDPINLLGKNAISFNWVPLVSKFQGSITYALPQMGVALISKVN
jgi:hypothetical protein